MTDWKKELAGLFEQQQPYKEEQNQKVKADSTAITTKKEEANEFLCTVVDSALRDLAIEFHKHERKAYNFGGSEFSRELEVRFQDRTEFRYTINVHAGTTSATVHASYLARYQNGCEEQGGGAIMKDNTQADIAEITKDDIINDFMKHYIGRETPCSY
ncbi:hypothetical protein KA005_26610 [bacterium]|nr:hypothetical protein [bacterium]